MSLSDSFSRILSYNLFSIYLYIIVIRIDIHESLKKLFPEQVYYFDYIQRIDSTASSIELPNWTCNDINYLVFDFSKFTALETLVIGDNCFGSVQTFQIDGLNRLKSVKIGKNSFTLERNYCGDDESKTFHILNCESLESIQIDEYSFSDFGGEFELKNLPQLQSIQIGRIGSDSFNFCHNSFVVRGIELILII